MPTYDTQAAVNAAWGEPLVYTRSGTGGTTSICGGRHIVGTEEGATSYGVYLIQKERYTVACTALGFEPRPRDTIAPAKKNARIITGIGGSQWLKFWTLEAQYPTLVDDLDSSATVYRATNAPSNEGLRNPTYAAVYSAVACRLQPKQREREFDTIGKVATRATYTAVFGTAVTLNAGDYVEVSSVKYEVVSQSEIESLGLLTFAEVERIS